ncbi:MAG TPA: GntR family transcriptional regulator [Clostridiaceae bacterium]|nr:GntR family transcriptional regulator [Clostridiaceae bacterium]
MVAINKYSNAPLYCQLKNLILEKIENGDFAADQKIPSEQDFCEQYNISRPTVRQAINELTASGQLYKLKGKGTFVSARKTQISIKDYTGFTDSILDSKNPSEKDIINTEIVTGQDYPELVEAFNLKPDGKTEFAAITFTNPLGNDMVSLSISYIPLSLFPEVIEDLQSNKDVLRGKYPLIPNSTRSTLDIISTDQKEALYLKLQPGQPLIRIKNILYSKSGQPVEYIITKYRADKTRLQFENHK